MVRLPFLVVRSDRGYEGENGGFCVESMHPSAIRESYGARSGVAVCAHGGT